MLVSEFCGHTFDLVLGLPSNLRFLQNGYAKEAGGSERNNGSNL